VILNDISGVLKDVVDELKSLKQSQVSKTSAAITQTPNPDIAPSLDNHFQPSYILNSNQPSNDRPRSYYGSQYRPSCNVPNTVMPAYDYYSSNYTDMNANYNSSQVRTPADNMQS
jgi:hypothetical protein